MNDNDQEQPKKGEHHGIKEQISGLGQKIIGEIESIGGILTGDPNTAAEGEFNLEVGTVREEVEDDLAGGSHRRDAEKPSEEV